MKHAPSPIAHRTDDGHEHLLAEHLDHVGALARRFLERMKLPDESFGALAERAGRWHDLGKFSDAFQSYIRGGDGSAAHLESSEASNDAGPTTEHAPTRGRVDHSSAGALLALEKSRKGRAGNILAAVIAGHHAGLADSAALRDRFERKKACLDAVRGHPDAARYLDENLPQLTGLPSWRPIIEAKDTGALERRLEFFTRMLFSTLCDADFLDTEAFFDSRRSALREPPVTVDALALALRAHLDQLEAQAASRTVTEVHRVRREVRAQCLARATERPGFFSLTVPTGGGKTLAGLHFALEHARAHGLDRVVCAVPYTAILEQSAAVYRAVFTGLGTDVVLEHHSALDPHRETPRNRIACENWDAPLVVTTTVQLFESLFANRTSRCRKIHNLARSVLVLDEAQSLPPALLPTILEGLQTLVEDYGASVVFCTATQPAFAKRPHFSCGVEPLREITAHTEESFERLRRVEVQWPASNEPTSYETLAAALAAETDVLAIVHRRDDARTLTAALDARLGDTSTVHLSALMHPQHRTRVLARALATKRSGGTLRLVATQLVEAGVDVDFAVVYRAFAGFDALAQAAGRCNREGRLIGRLGQLRVFHAPTEPPSGLLTTARDIARAMLAQEPSIDLFAPDTQSRFFKRLYSNLAVASSEDPIQKARAKQNFATVAERFTMIDDSWSAPVVVVEDDLVPLVQQLETFGPSRRLLRQFQQHTVALSKQHRERALRSGWLRLVTDTVCVLEGLWKTSVYDNRFGLRLDFLLDGIADPASLVL